MVIKEQNGTYTAQVKIKDPITGKWLSKKKRGFKYKREAQAWEAEARAEQVLPVSSAVTFHQAADQMLDHIEASPVSRQKHNNAYHRRFSDYYDKPIKSITKLQLDCWRSQLSKDDSIAYLTKRDTLQYVKSVFHYASAIYGIPDVSATLLPLKKPVKEDTDIHTWTIEQFNAFNACVKGRVYQLFFETLFWTGMRRGECLALQKTDLNGNRLHIHGSIKHFKNGISPTKNSSSIRTIVLDDQLVSDLQPLLQIEGPFLFGGDHSLPISEVQRRFTSAKKASGVPNIRLHDLRHSHASILIAANVNIVAVSKRLGHASIEQTLKTYTHLIQKTEEEMIRKIDDLHKD